MNNLDDVVREFLLESYENLDHLDRDLLELEKDPASHNALASVFRTIHTIKGTCGFFGFAKLETVSHAGENLLSLLRDRQLTLTPEISQALLVMVDAIRRILTQIEADGTEGHNDVSSLSTTLTHLATKGKAPPLPAKPPEAKADAKEWKDPLTPKPPEAEERTGGGMLFSEGPAEPLHETPERPEKQAKDEIHETPEIHENPEERGKGVSESTLRVDVGLLDKLMTLMGELVLARNQIVQVATTRDDPALTASSQRVKHIATELHEAVMKMRMQPIRNIWAKFPRLVRDLALMVGKQVHLEMEGADTELDKTLIEAIKDPLTHTIRNAVDHGIERPEERIARGKPASGRISLRAFHEGGQVNIEIADDGAGINPERVKQKAIARGLLTPEQAAHLSERELIHLIFQPGFSTADQVTTVSGRGVGMDVVKTNIGHLGGTVDIHNTIGSGMTLKIKLPLTLAIIPALIVNSNAERYAIPQVSVLELVRVEDNEKHDIDTIHGTPVYRLRGNLIPLIYLDRELDLSSERPFSSIPHDSSDGSTSIVVLQVAEQSFGLVVDQVNDTEDIVVKPLSKHLQGHPVFSGATIMGDGKVVLILDVLGLAQRARLLSDVVERKTRSESLSNDTSSQKNTEPLLLLQGPDDNRMAIPLSMVTRLEEFPLHTIERLRGRDVVQYRGGVLSLIYLSPGMPEYHTQHEPGMGAADTLDVVIYSKGTRSVGLIVHRILDIVHENVMTREQSAGNGALGSIIVHGRVTELLDVHSLIYTADPGFFDASPYEQVGSDAP